MGLLLYLYLMADVINHVDCQVFFDGLGWTVESLVQGLDLQVKKLAGLGHLRNAVPNAECYNKADVVASCFHFFAKPE